MKLAIKNHTLLTAALIAFAAVPATASQRDLLAAAPATPTASEAVVKPLTATKSIWASGLRAPQGMARDRKGNVYVAEFAGGQIAKFAADGKLLVKLGADLKSPAWIERVGDTLYVSERKANRLLKLTRDDKLTPIAAPVVEPLGLAVHKGGLLVIAHTTSGIWQLNGKSGLKSIYIAPDDTGKRYGYRCLAVDKDGSIFITDESEGQVLLLTPAGRLSVWAKGLDDPTAIVIAPDGQIYVAEEGAGRVSRLNAEGVPTIVADGLGQVRDIEFLDARTFLATDRKDGVIWRVSLNGEAVTATKN